MGRGGQIQDNHVVTDMDEVLHARRANTACAACDQSDGGVFHVCACYWLPMTPCKMTNFAEKVALAEPVAKLWLLLFRAATLNWYS